MNKTAWIATAVLGLVVTASSEAHAHPPYLQGVSDFVTAEIAAPACSLPGMTCGLCHHPSAGDPLADIVVDIMGIETTLRDRSFYEGLTGEGGWMHSMHMPGDMTHINMNRMALTDEALPAILAAGYSNGTVLLVRMTDGAEILVRKNDDAAVTALGWSADGGLLAFAAGEGTAGLLAL